ncbi:glycosyltransferase family 4 protein, partial [Brachyspira catarrhinii]
MLWKKINIVFDISRSYNAISSNSGMAGVFNYEVNILTNIINSIYIYTIYLAAECDEDFFRSKICKQIKEYSRCKFINKNNLENIIKNIDAYVSFSLKIPEIIINHNIKNYLVIHDLLPLLHPDYYSSNKQKQLEAANFGKNVYDSINCNTTIITISENSKSDIEKYIIKDKQNKVVNLSSGINKNKFFKIKYI